jgi:hypothetical protein
VGKRRLEPVQGIDKGYDENLMADIAYAIARAAILQAVLTGPVLQQEEQAAALLAA